MLCLHSRSTPSELLPQARPRQSPASQREQDGLACPCSMERSPRRGADIQITVSNITAVTSSGAAGVRSTEGKGGFLALVPTSPQAPRVAPPSCPPLSCPQHTAHLHPNSSLPYLLQWQPLSQTGPVPPREGVPPSGAQSHPQLGTGGPPASTGGRRGQCSPGLSVRSPGPQQLQAGQGVLLGPTWPPLFIYLL